MRLRHLPPLVLGLALFGSPKLMLSASAAQSDQNVQHLTCITNARSLTCTIKETQETVSLQRLATVEAAQMHHSEVLEEISDAFIGVLFGVLPIALFVVIVLHHKRDMARAKRLEQLEKIWQES